MLRQFILKHEKGVHRALEILPGFVSWNLILFPYWGILLIPTATAYFILFFDIFWFYRSATLAATALIAHYRIQAAEALDWPKELESFPDAKKVKHVVIITTYKEPLKTLDRTFESLARQSLSPKQIIPVLAMEAKESETERQQKANYLQAKFAKLFDKFLLTVHTLKPHEVAGKASNERHAALETKRLLTQSGYNIDYLTVTSCDADHVYHRHHFAYLAFKFLDDPERYHRFWQAAVLFYNNVWQLPALTRVANTFGSIWNLAILTRRDRLINQQNYSLSFRLLDQAGYWDPDIIPEDYHLFFKAFFATKGKVEVEPIYLPLFADAAQSTSWWKTLKNQYSQFMRWAWGVSDDPFVIKQYFLSRQVPFWDKTIRLVNLLIDHFLWPVNWFIITIGLTLPSFLNPDFSRTILGYTVPKLSSTIFTITLLFLAINLAIDAKRRPPRPAQVPRWRALLQPLEFVMMPFVMFFFNALPGLDAHTRLMLGRYIKYKVTEKV